MSKELKHVGIIMDGNRRWARERGLPVVQGHMTGAKNVRPTIETAADMGIKHITVFAFSHENWKREKEEVQGLMGVFREMLNSADINELMENNVRVNVLGNYSEFPDDIVERIEEIHDESINNDTITAHFALGYGGREEILHGIQSLLDQGAKNVTEEIFRSELYTKDIPDPDLIIRPGGEQRISGFLLFQSAYAELYFTQVYWPDFNKEEFRKAVDWYNDRERRFGK